MADSNRGEHWPSMVLLLAPVLAALTGLGLIWNQAETPRDSGVWIAALALLASGSLLAMWQIGRLLKPLRPLIQATQQVLSGTEVAQAFVSADGPLSQLAADFNRMSSAVAQREDDLTARFERMSTVLGAMLEGVLAVDERQRILFANPAAGRMLDFNAAEASGKPLLEMARNHMLHEAVAEALANRSDTSADMRHYEFTSMRDRGQTMAFRATCLPGEPCPGVVLVMQDVSELRRLETMRQEFVANVSHELKTPLTAIKAYTETLLDGAIHDVSINRDFLQKIDIEADRLYELILDMLRLAQIESGHGQFEMSTVSVFQTVSDCIRRSQPAAKRKQITLTSASTPDVSARADQEGLREMIDNLIDNAIKYTELGGNVSVSWHAADGEVVIDVTDDGIGIPEEEQGRVFERFYRVDKARSRELGSTGLGLSIIKHLAQTFGGSVSVVSQPHVGSTFSLRLPSA